LRELLGQCGVADTGVLRGTLEFGDPLSHFLETLGDLSLGFSNLLRAPGCLGGHRFLVGLVPGALAPLATARLVFRLALGIARRCPERVEPGTCRLGRFCLAFTLFLYGRHPDCEFPRAAHLTSGMIVARESDVVQRVTGPEVE